MNARLQKTQSRVWRWRRAVSNSKLPSTTRAVLRALTEFMNSDGGCCYPSQKDISRAAGYCENTVGKHLAIAVRAGWLLSERGDFTGQKWKRLSYQALFPVAASTTENSTEEAHDMAVSAPEGAPPRGEKVPHEMGQDNTSPITSPITHAGLREEAPMDRRRVEAAFWAWLSTYPRAPRKTPSRSLRIWFRLTQQQRDACIALTGAFVATVKDKSHLPGPETYLRERRWEQIATSAADYRPERMEAKFGGPLWMGWYLWQLVQPPTGVIKVTATEERMILDGKLNRDALMREKLRKFGWPSALSMLEKRGKQTFFTPSAAAVISEGFVWVGQESPLHAAWVRAFEDRGWNVPQSFGAGLYFPPVGDTAGNLDTEVAAAIAAFEKHAKEVLNG